jgi:hypothetical protein
MISDSAVVPKKKAAAPAARAIAAGLHAAPSDGAALVRRAVTVAGG